MVELFGRPAEMGRYRRELTQARSRIVQKQLEAVATANQDPLLGYVPLVGIDMWEHAFYLDYVRFPASGSSSDFPFLSIKLTPFVPLSLLQRL